ncbi:MAG TPA: DUF6036 family nucleotidyltransferase [Myxococcales bacterium]|jgi:hypothetical protein
MNRAQLEHIIRAAAVIADDDELIIVGSQAILGEHPDAPAEALVSEEADVYPKNHPERADIIDGAIGELSQFHDSFGYYAQGVGEETATLPQGWRDRLVPVRGPGTRGATGWCLETHDLAVSKLVAGREKDLEFVGVLVRHQLVVPEILRQRLAETRLAEPLRDAVLRRLSACLRA